MRRNITLAAGVVVLLIGTLMTASSAEAKHFKHSFSGWGVATEIDSNGDGARADSLTTESRGTFGPGTGNVLQEVAAVPSGICDDNPAILKFEVLSRSATSRSHSGDLVFSVLDHGTVCFDVETPAFPTFTFEIHAVIVGGTGRFEGATGSSISIGEGVTLNGELGVRPTHTAIWGSLEGEIFLAH